MPDIAVERSSGHGDSDENLRKFDLDISDVTSSVHVLQESLEAVEAVTECTSIQVSMLAETIINPRAYCNWIELKFPRECTFPQIRSYFSLLAKENEIPPIRIRLLWRPVCPSYLAGTR